MATSTVKERMGSAAKAQARDLLPRSPETILFVANTTEFGGAEKHLLELIRRLGRSGVRSSILCLGPDFYTERMNRDGILGVTVCHQIQPQRVRGWFQALREAKPDIIVFVCGWVWSFPWYAYGVARLAGARRVFCLLHLTPDPVPAKLEGRPVRNLVRCMIGGQVRLRLAACLCRKIICVSDRIRDTLVRDYRFPAHKTITVYNGVALPDFAPSETNRAAVRTSLGILAGEYVLVCAARLSEVKRIDILLSALARVLRNGVSCKCIILGEGPLREQLSAQACALGLSAYVFFEGFKDDVRPYLQAADAFVLTSRQEGLPISLLEAMACGLPCVVTDVGGNAEAVAQQVTGIVVPAGGAAEVADAISYLVTHPRERGQMSKMARARVSQVFNIENQMEELMKLILN